MDKQYVCKQCGSTDIEVQAWVNPNKHTIGDYLGGGLDCSCWCNECHETTTYKEADRSRFMRIGQRVFCADATYSFGRIVSIANKTEDGWVDDETVLYVALEDSGSEDEIFGTYVYVIDEAWTTRLHREVCYEHIDGDYTHFIPSIDECFVESDLSCMLGISSCTTL